MRKEIIKVDEMFFTLYSLNTLIIGSGPAALTAAIQLYEMGQTNIAIATSNWDGGGANGCRGDKQAYYKLSLAGIDLDSPMDMASDLFNSKAAHGDIALCEAQGSIQAFFNLANLNVPFPHDRFGAFVGFKSDHDPRQRGTTAGPDTSKKIHAQLAKRVKDMDIPVLDEHEVFTMMTKIEGDDRHVVGALAFDKKNVEAENLGIVVFNAVNIIMATGGPGGIYKNATYPETQLGSMGMAIEAGAVSNNLMESQFGLASLKYNVLISGAMQHVIPRYISTDQEGNDEQEFLSPYFQDMATLAKTIFKKGDQWVFDAREVEYPGSSLIDLLVQREISRKGRRVFLDYSRNPGVTGPLTGFSLNQLEKKSFDYLRNSSATQMNPFQRLQNLSPQLVELFKGMDVNLAREYLEIGLCAYHSNGGLKGNIWWESNVKHLFPVGEINGSQGVYSPGGAALNAGQVGAIRSAMYISKRYNAVPLEVTEFMRIAKEQISRKYLFSKRVVDVRAGSKTVIRESRRDMQERMTSVAGHFRDIKKIKKAVIEAWNLHYRLENEMKIQALAELPDAFKNIDLCLTHILFLEAVEEYIAKGGKSRGSYLVADPAGELPCRGLEEDLKYRKNTGDSPLDKQVLEIHLGEHNQVMKEWVDVRPIPHEISDFEDTWNKFQANFIVR
jgi:succinate dehydrogenase/fumarate reductase flavoprotein subunit